MANTIYLVSGCKGGVGKSIVSMALVDYLQMLGVDVLLIETDNSNADVGRAYKNSVTTHLLNLDDNDGWTELLHLCVARPGSTVVINGAARDSLGVNKYGKIFNDSLPGLKRKLVTLWVINRLRDSLEMLKRFMVAIPESDVHVVRNGYYGPTGKFELYNNSALRKRIEGSGGKSVTFSNLGTRVSDAIFSVPMTIAEAMKKLPMGNRVELARWRNEVKKILEEIIDE